MNMTRWSDPFKVVHIYLSRLLGPSRQEHSLPVQEE